MSMVRWKNNKKGISDVEILTVVAVIAIALTSLLGLFSFSLISSTLIKKTSQAKNIAEETIEAVRNFRDGTAWETDGLGTLPIGVAYHPEKTSDIPPKWQLVPGEETINSFTREVTFGDVQRDGNDNIVESGGINDPDTREITTIVSWQERGRTHQLEIVTYLTNWRQ